VKEKEKGDIIFMTVVEIWWVSVTQKAQLRLAAQAFQSGSQAIGH
jgi:hypothetical protein